MVSREVKICCANSANSLDTMSSKPAKTAVPKPPTVERGNMKPAEIKPLVIAASQLDQILFTIINRIAAVEGTGSRKSRNKSQCGSKASS